MRISKTFLTVDIVIFNDVVSFKQILLIKRKHDPYKDYWALPGGFVNEHEDLEVAALRELKEETNLHFSSLKQLKAFGKPFRDPRSHVVSIAFVGSTNQYLDIKAADDAKEIGWFSIDNLPNIAFDHQEIINFALGSL
ncbi:MAG: NUDIX hydrolase [Flavobacterium sp.]|nr:NUDIX hydrolase [Flavobacterium sp.]